MKLLPYQPAAFWAGVLSLLIWYAAAAQGGELETKFRGMKARIGAELRSPKPEIRERALEKLREFPIPDAAELLLVQGQLAQYPDVARGCYETLRSFANTPDVARFLITDLQKELKLGRSDPVQKVRLEMLFAASEPQVAAQLPPLIELIGKTPSGLLLLATIVDEHAASFDPKVQKTLLNMVELPVVTTHPGLRRALVQGLCKVNEKAAVTQLVQMHTTAEGETRADIERRLVQLSGLNAADRPDWGTWWKEKEATFMFPMGPLLETKLAAGAGTPSYYGLPLYGSKLVFIADYSGSMEGAKLEAAKRELVGTIGQLPGDVRFNIIAFNSQVFPWQRELQVVSPLSRQDAVRFVASGRATAMTASYDALQAALLQDCDAIYFLTDGSPTVGQIKDPEQIVSAITRINRVRRATIHCIGIGVGAAGGEFDVFLRDLAAKNFGAYRRID